MKISVAFAAALLAGQASAQDSYVYGGVSHTEADFGYTYAPIDEGTSLEADGTNAFLGFGRVFLTKGQVAFAGEADVSFGKIAVGPEQGDTLPCVSDSPGCTAKVSSLATLRVVAAAQAGKLRPFATLGIAYGKVEGAADTFACDPPTDCSFDESRFGVAAGLGATYEVNASWRLRGEYLHVDLGKPEFSDPASVVSDDITANQFRLGAEHRF